MISCVPRIGVLLFVEGSPVDTESGIDGHSVGGPFRTTNFAVEHDKFHKEELPRHEEFR